MYPARMMNNDASTSSFSWAFTYKSLSWMEIKRDSSVFQLLYIFYLKGTIHWFVYINGFLQSQLKSLWKQSVTVVVSCLLWLWRRKKQKKTAIVVNRDFNCIMGNVGSSGFGVWPILKVKIPKLLLLLFWPSFFKCNLTVDVTMLWK